MNRLIFLLIFWPLVFFLLIMYPIECFAQEGIVGTPVPEGLPARNPFEPQVPREPEVSQQPKPVQPVEVQPREILPPPPVPPVVVAPVEPQRQVVEPPMPALNVGGVVWNTRRPQAIVNGQIVGVGDMVAGVRIVDIRKTGVTVSSGGRTVSIEMQQP